MKLRIVVVAPKGDEAWQEATAKTIAYAVAKIGSRKRKEFGWPGEISIGAMIGGPRALLVAEGELGVEGAHFLMSLVEVTLLAPPNLVVDDTDPEHVTITDTASPFRGRPMLKDKP